jgi:Phosphotransferase enzyme family
MGVDLLDRPSRAILPHAPSGESDIAEVVRTLVQANKARLFAGDDAVEIAGVELGPRKYFNENRFHRRVTVRFRKAGAAGSLALWLKFRPGLDRLYPVLLCLHERLGGQLIPAPYFAWHSDDERTALLASAFIRGTPLRDKLLRLAAIRQSSRLEPTFETHGGKMRRFHDASPAGEAIYAQEVVALVERAVAATRHLDAAEKAAVLGHAAKAGEVLGLRALPTVRNHNDWILRNIVVAPDGADYLIDCDSMRYRPNWRWYDVAFLLLNLESSEKWAPLVTLPTVTPLWRTFWKGYLGGRAIPDGLSAVELTAIFYLVRLHWLFDGVVRRPNFEVMTGRLNRRFMRNLKKSLVAGEYSRLDFLKTV